MRLRMMRSSRMVFPALLWSFLVFGCLPSGHADMVASYETAGLEGHFRRGDYRAKIQALLSEERILNRLAEMGLAAEEIQDRLDRLTDEEIQDLATQVDQVNAGQGSSLILILLALVVFVLFVTLMGVGRAR